MHSSMRPRSSFLHGLKKQTSCFFKEKIQTIRLVVTDTTRAQLLANAATNKSASIPDRETMVSISKAAFEVGDFWRIVEILHRRLSRFNKKQWRKSYKALILLEHLLIHGPRSTFPEFKADKDAIKMLATFQYNDKSGNNWGPAVRKQCERVLLLLDDENILEEERNRARKLMYGFEELGSLCEQSTRIKGSGSFQRQSSKIRDLGSFYQQSSGPLDNEIQIWESFLSSQKSNPSFADYNQCPWGNSDSSFKHGFTKEDSHQQTEISVAKSKSLEPWTHCKITSGQIAHEIDMCRDNSSSTMEDDTISRINLLTQLHEYDDIEESTPLLGAKQD